MNSKIKVLLTVFGMLAIIFQSSVFAAIPEVTRTEILNYAKTAVGSWYVWGGDKWDPNNRSWGGADCSGLVIKAWMIPYKAPYNKSVGHPWSTYSFYNQSTHWTRISRSDLQPGDALVRRGSSSGHTFLYAGKDNWGTAMYYEAARTGTRIRYGTRSVTSDYVAIRRKNLRNSSTTTAPSTQPFNPVATPSSSYSVKEVTASALNVRTGPSTGYRKIGTVYYGQRYVAVQTSGSWVQIYFNGGTAWFHGSYVRSVSGGQVAAINVSGLNVRTGPSTGYGRVGTSHKPEVYVVVARQGFWSKIWFGGAARWCFTGNGYGSVSSY